MSYYEQPDQICSVWSRQPNEEVQRPRCDNTNWYVISAIPGFKYQIKWILTLMIFFILEHLMF